MTKMIRNLNKVMDDLQCEQLVVSGFNGTTEEKAEKEGFLKGILPQQETIRLNLIFSSHLQKGPDSRKDSKRGFHLRQVVHL